MSIENPITAIDLYVSGLIQRAAGKPAGIDMAEAKADYQRATAQLAGAVGALRLIAEDRVPCDDLAVETAVPDAVRAFAREAIGGR
jgi:hypothetical protein